MAEDNTNVQSTRDDKIKIIIDALSQIKDIPSTETNAKLFKGQIDLIIKSYNDKSKGDLSTFSEKEKENIFTLLKTDLKTTNIMISTFNDTSAADNSYVKALEKVANLAAIVVEASLDNKGDMTKNIVEINNAIKEQNDIAANRNVKIETVKSKLPVKVKTEILKKKGKLVDEVAKNSKKFKDDISSNINTTITKVKKTVITKLSPKIMHNIQNIMKSNKIKFDTNINNRGTNENVSKSNHKSKPDRGRV